MSLPSVLPKAAHLLIFFVLFFVFCLIGNAACCLGVLVLGGRRPTKRKCVGPIFLAIFLTEFFIDILELAGLKPAAKTGLEP